MSSKHKCEEGNSSLSLKFMQLSGPLAMEIFVVILIASMAICKCSHLPRHFWVYWLISIITDAKPNNLKGVSGNRIGYKSLLMLFLKERLKHCTSNMTNYLALHARNMRWYIFMQHQTEVYRKSIDQLDSTISDWRFQICSSTNFICDFNFEDKNIAEHSTTSKIGLPSSKFYVSLLKNQFGLLSAYFARGVGILLCLLCN